MNKVLKNLLIGATVVTVGVIVYSAIKNEKNTSTKKTEKKQDVVPVMTKSNNTEEFVERMKQRAAAKRAAQAECPAEVVTEITSEESNLILPADEIDQGALPDKETVREDVNPENEN